MKAIILTSKESSSYFINGILAGIAFPFIVAFFFTRQEEKIVLFVCIENAARSQIAEAFFRKYAPRGYMTISGGTRPAGEINHHYTNRGYAKGVADAKLVQSSSLASTTMSPDMVDCDSSVDPQTSNVDYCSGYPHGFADTNNNALSAK